MYSSWLFLISSWNSSRSVPSRSPSSRRCGKYVTRSEISARDKRRAFAFGSFARNGLIGVRTGVGIDVDVWDIGAEGAGDAGGGVSGGRGTDDGGAIAGLGGIDGGTGDAPGGRIAAIGPVPDARRENGGRGAAEGAEAGPIGARLDGG